MSDITPWECSEMSESSVELRSLRDLVASIAGPRGWSDTRESWLARAARRAGISYRQTKGVWYGEITDPYHRSVTKLRAARQELAGRYASIAANQLRADEDFYRDSANTLLSAARDLRRLDSPGGMGTK